MALMVKETKSFDPIPADMHHGIAVWLYDVGTHSYDFKGRTITSRKAILSFEIPDLRIEIEHEGKTLNLPRMISKEFTLSLGKKAKLRPLLETWRGRPFTSEELAGFDLQKVLGVNAMLQVIHEEKDGDTYARLNAILPLYKGLPPKQPENPIRFFTFGESTEIPEGTPEWIVKRLADSEEWAKFGKSLTPDESAQPAKPAFMNDAVAPPADTESGCPF